MLTTADLLPGVNTARLLAQINAGASSSTGALTPILVCAPAGYGKTRLVSAWLSSQDHGEIVRLRCTPRSADTFGQDLLRALSPEGSIVPTSPSEVQASLHQLFASLSDPLTIEIDDYHLATTPENDLALLDLINPNVRLIIVARRVSVLDGPLAARRVPMLRIGAQDLALTPDEAHVYASKFTNLDTELLSHVISIASGWPLAIRAALDPTMTTNQISASVSELDPLAALNRFAQRHLETLSPVTRKALLATSLLEVVDRAQIAATAGTSLQDAHSATNELLELGLITPAASGDTDEFSCHPAVRRGIFSRAERTLTKAEKNALFASRADKISSIAPASAMGLYLAAGEYEAAEIELSRNFVTITDEASSLLSMLHALPNELLSTHPTFLAARIYLESPNPGASPDTLWEFLRMWRISLKQRFERPVTDPTLQVAYLMQAMVSARYLGNFELAAQMAREIDARLVSSTSPSILPTLEGIGHGARRVVGSGSYPIYHSESALTALTLGNLDEARRGWMRLQRHAESLIEHPWYGFPSGSIRTVTDPASGERWRAAALIGKAFTEALDGDIRTASSLLAEADAYISETGVTPPGFSVATRETVRAHVAIEHRDSAPLRSALESVQPILDRLEYWPLVLIAQTEEQRFSRDVGWALTFFENELSKSKRSRKGGGAWHCRFITYQALLNTLLGRFTVTEQLLGLVDSEAPGAMVERARLALFSGDSVGSLILTQRAGTTNLTKRQHATRVLIAACAAWSMGQKSDAIAALAAAFGLINRYELPSILHGVPFALLHEIAVAARDTGIIDVVSNIDDIPEHARGKQYLRLTDMELKTLASIETHGTINDTAEALFVTPATVKKHLSAVYRKLGAKGRDEAILLATRMALLPVDG